MRQTAITSLYGEEGTELDVQNKGIHHTTATYACHFFVRNLIEETHQGSLSLPVSLVRTLCCLLTARLHPRSLSHQLCIQTVKYIHTPPTMAADLPESKQQLPTNTSVMKTYMSDKEEQLPTNPSTGAMAPSEQEDTDIHERASLTSRSASLFSETSETSTLKYTGEPFIEFKVKVEKLCETLWPPPKSISRLVATRLRANKLLRSLIPPPKGPVIERLRGGDYNRITSISLPSSYGVATSKLILRNSRWEDSEGRPDRDVAILDFVRQRTTIPVPEIIAKNFSNDNALGMPYVVQRRVPGSDIDSMWGRLSHQQRCVIAREMGRVIKSLLSLESPMPGLIEAASADALFADSADIVPFELRDNGGNLIDDRTASGDIATPQTPGEFFKTVFGKWHAYTLDADDPETELFKELLDTVRDMDYMGVFSSDMHCLCHVDLHSRNVMAEVQQDDTIRLTAVLDWDEAVFAPKFVNCQPPWWLWKEDGDARLDENGCETWPYELPAAEGFPATPENQELKRLFEEHAGPEYRHLATNTHCRLGRGLFILAKEGLVGSQHFNAAERIIQEWKDLKAESNDLKGL